MLIQQKTGNINSNAATGKAIDWLVLEWYETRKRILHKKTNSGKDVVLKFLKENPELREGDILSQDENSIIVVTIKSCEAIVIKAKDNFEVASVCYEIGNKHLPLFYEENELLVPYEEPLFKLLRESGYEVCKMTRKLVSPLRTSVAAHGISSSLFSKILQLTNTPPGE